MRVMFFFCLQSHLYLEVYGLLDELIAVVAAKIAKEDNPERYESLQLNKVNNAVDILDCSMKPLSITACNTNRIVFQVSKATCLQYGC